MGAYGRLWPKKGLAYRCLLIPTHSVLLCVSCSCPNICIAGEVFCTSVAEMEWKWKWKCVLVYLNGTDAFRCPAAEGSAVPEFFAVKLVKPDGSMVTATIALAQSETGFLSYLPKLRPLAHSGLILSFLSDLVAL
jgi:hypothetical protein